GVFAASLVGPWSPVALLSMASPGYACLLVSEAVYRTAPGAFWTSTAITHGLGWLSLLLTVFLLPRVWQDRPAGTWGLRWRGFTRQAMQGNASERVAFRRRLLSVNPIGWLASRERRVCWYPWLFLSSMASIGWVSCWAL